EDLYTFWSCDGREGLSRIRDLSLSGLFIESPVEQEVGAPMKLDFLAEEGPIRANAAVCYVKPGRGVGLKLIAIHQQDFERFAGLIQSKRTKAEACCTSEVQQQCTWRVRNMEGRKETRTTQRIPVLVSNLAQP